MSYELINPIQQFNFQINRVLTYGQLACDKEAIRQKTASIKTLNDWDEVWSELAKQAEAKKEYLHAAYSYRMEEFFLKENNPKKEICYQKSIENYYLGFDQQLQLSYQRYDIPFKQGTLNCIRISPENKKGTIIVCGGYDSFIEEFVLQVIDLSKKGYEVILFEGPGQGRCLRQKMYFSYDFEKPVKALLDYFDITKCAMIGISWGGYFALRSAAFEPRIQAAVAFDTLYDGQKVMMNVYPKPISKLLNYLYRRQKGKWINLIVSRLQKKSILADWAISQGMYITATATPYEFYQSLSQHTLKGIGDKIRQDVLLLAGEKDHYIPNDQFYKAKECITNARSLTGRIFTEEEGGEQHCQIGNTQIAIDFILKWLEGKNI